MENEAQTSNKIGIWYQGYYLKPNRSNAVFVCVRFLFFSFLFFVRPFGEGRHHIQNGVKTKQNKVKKRERKADRIVAAQRTRKND